jgi:hypothetical protein
VVLKCFCMVFGAWLGWGNYSTLWADHGAGWLRLDWLKLVRIFFEKTCVVQTAVYTLPVIINKLILLIYRSFRNRGLRHDFDSIRR